MRYRRFPRLGWRVSEVGYDVWGIAGGEGGWTRRGEVMLARYLKLRAIT
jgi:hypothetical protein